MQTKEHTRVQVLRETDIRSSITKTKQFQEEKKQEHSEQNIQHNGQSICIPVLVKGLRVFFE